MLNKVMGPFIQHSVLDHADPAGQHVVIHEVLEPLNNSLLDYADPAGQHAVITESSGTVRAFGS